MAESNLPNFSENDPLDINELASLNDDISVDFIEQLQNKLSQEAGGGSAKTESGDGALFEEVQKEEKPLNLRFDDSIDDNFIKKYKAKLNKQQLQVEETKEAPPEPVKIPEPVPEPVPETVPETMVVVQENTEIESLTSGSIVEKPAEQEQIDYNESLDFLDDNVKYSKYVIYIDPENTEFIDSLTVKERKNLINRILREQDDIAITKRRLNMVQTVIKHSIVAIITIAIFIPVIYYTINASLEASINNYRRSQGMFKTLYKEKGKIKKTTHVNYN